VTVVLVALLGRTPTLEEFLARRRGLAVAVEQSSRDRSAAVARREHAMPIRTSVRVWAVLAAALAACGDQAAPPPTATDAAPAPWTAYTDADRGYGISFPHSWHRATERISRLSDPRELVSVATMPLAWRATDCEAFAGAAGASMGPSDVVVTVWERGTDSDPGWRGYPPRPRKFAPASDSEPTSGGCGEPPGTVTHWRNFSQYGRRLHTLVRIGPDAPPNAASEAWQILDGLHLDSGYQPDWRGTG
jgi:hypothetical protein